MYHLAAVHFVTRQTETDDITMLLPVRSAKNWSTFATSHYKKDCVVFLLLTIYLLNFESVMDNRSRMDSVMHKFQLITNACATIHYVGEGMVTVTANLLAQLMIG